MRSGKKSSALREGRGGDNRSGLFDDIITGRGDERAASASCNFQLKNSKLFARNGVRVEMAKVRQRFR